MPVPNLQSLNDGFLIHLLKNGNEQAYTVIFNRYNRMLYAIAYKYIKNIDISKDIVQCTFIKLWNLRNDLPDEVNLRNFLYTIVKNSVLNEIRNNTIAMERNYEYLQNNPEFENNLFNSLQNKETLQYFHKILDHLPGQQRKVCYLKLIENLSNNEIAQKLDISIPTVKTHYSVGIKFIREKMKNLMIYLILVLYSLLF